MHIEIYRDMDKARRTWRFRLVAPNGEKMTASEGYTRKWNARRAARKAHPGVEIR